MKFNETCSKKHCRENLDCDEKYCPAIKFNKKLSVEFEKKEEKKVNEQCRLADKFEKSLKKVFNNKGFKKLDADFKFEIIKELTSKINY